MHQHIEGTTITYEVNVSPISDIIVALQDIESDDSLPRHRDNNLINTFTSDCMSILTIFTFIFYIDNDYCRFQTSKRRILHFPIRTTLPPGAAKHHRCHHQTPAAIRCSFARALRAGKRHGWNKEYSPAAPTKEGQHHSVSELAQGTFIGSMAPSV
jgi:hypothetical protein